MDEVVRGFAIGTFTDDEFDNPGVKDSICVIEFFVAKKSASTETRLAMRLTLGMRPAF